MDKKKNYETSLPEGYIPAMRVDTNDKKLAQTYMLFAYLPFIIIVPLLCVIANYASGYNILKNWKSDRAAIVILIALAANFAYVPLHELTHGAAYKLLTGGKLTFGYGITSAFCGMPDYYVRKKASFTALIMPFVVFTVLFGGLTVALWAVKPLYGIAAGILLSLHLGGCFGDLRWAYFYLTKFRGCDTLRRDTGPEQVLYIPEEEAEKLGIRSEELGVNN